MEDSYGYLGKEHAVRENSKSKDPDTRVLIELEEARKRNRVSMGESDRPHHSKAALATEGRTSDSVLR